MVMDRDVTWGGEHTVQCTDDALWNCVPEICIILLTSVTQKNSVQRKNSNFVICILSSHNSPLTKECGMLI